MKIRVMFIILCSAVFFLSVLFVAFMQGDLVAQQQAYAGQQVQQQQPPQPQTQPGMPQQLAQKAAGFLGGLFKQQQPQQQVTGVGTQAPAPVQEQSGPGQLISGISGAARRMAGPIAQRAAGAALPQLTELERNQQEQIRVDEEQQQEINMLKQQVNELLKKVSQQQPRGGPQVPSVSNYTKYEDPQLGEVEEWDEPDGHVKKYFDPSEDGWVEDFTPYT